LKTLEWNIKTVTPFEFIQFFLSQGIIFNSDALPVKSGELRAPNEKVACYIRKYSEFFADLCLQGNR
jgi:hypothetical protein